MATWTRTEDDDYITYQRDDGTAGYKISKNHPHFHAEQWMTWEEAPGHLGGSHPTTDTYFRQTLIDNGHTVVG